ncbi:hypothetical protein GCM10010171_22990 [Actinokineospora fastidiosa]|uniref:EamA domain-containing protein n=1 Tax=Actinokineospora fastidiosa TaxID=1816 RepID=A0A918LBJ3_9PSEU|nr:hypothetical protein GCM10010171_22990 [Actinokineospora fastidiosa]
MFDTGPMAPRRTVIHPTLAPQAAARLAPLLVVASIVGIQFGQAWGKSLFGELTPLGVVALRLGFAAIVMLAVIRPRAPADRGEWLVVIGLGMAIAGMNLFIYPALDRLPVGVAVTFQFLGPFAVALVGSRKWLDAVWAVLACAGVVLFVVPDTPTSPLSWLGIVFALLSGASWAAYIVVNKHAGNKTGTPAALALAVACAAAVTVPVGLVTDGAALVGSGRIVLIGLAIAVISAVIPYLLDWLALRRISARLFGVLGSLEPAIGALAAAVLLTERLSLSQTVAVALVVTASVCASATDRERAGSDRPAGQERCRGTRFGGP